MQSKANSRVLQAKILKKDIKEKIDNWNERSSFAVKGIKNLTVSDLDTLELYADEMIKSGGNGFYGLSKPLGNIRQVLVKYGLLDQEN